MSLHNADPRTIYHKAETDSRSEVRREWEEISLNNRPRRTMKSGSGPLGDANLCILQLNNPETRAEAMQKLCSVHRQMPDLGVLLWHAFGAVSSLLQEVLTVYLRDDVSDAEAARVINALDLLESIAEHPRTKIYFVCGKLHEVVAPLAGQDTRQSDRGYISDKDYKCILIQLLVDDFLAKVLWPSIRYGEPRTQYLAVQLLAKVMTRRDALAIFVRDPDTRKNLFYALKHTHNILSRTLPMMCSIVERLQGILLDMGKPTAGGAKNKTAIGAEMSSSRTAAQQ